MQFQTTVTRGIFVGLGGSFNSVKVDNEVSALGVSQVTSGGVLVGVGTAGGPAAPFADTTTTFAPTMQIGH